MKRSRRPRDPVWAGAGSAGSALILDTVQNRTYIEVVHQRASDLLRGRGLQVTAQRLAVMRAVAQRPHGTADEVARDVRTEIGAISRQAVYDALGILVEHGLIRRIQPAGSPARYEDRTGDNHHHLICRTCGRMIDVDCAVGAAPCLKPSDKSGFDIDEAEVLFWGRCPDCIDENRPASAMPDLEIDGSRSESGRADPARQTKF